MIGLDLEGVHINVRVNLKLNSSKSTMFQIQSSSYLKVASAFPRAMATMVAATLDRFCYFCNVGETMQLVPTKVKAIVLSLNLLPY